MNDLVKRLIAVKEKKKISKAIRFHSEIRIQKNQIRQTARSLDQA